MATERAKRRADGSIQVVSDGVYKVVLNNGVGPDGKRQRATRRVTGGRKAAEVVLRQMMAERDRGNLVQAGQGMTVAEYMGRWLREDAQRRLAPSTYRGYESVVRAHVVPGLGTMRVDKVTRAHISAFYEKLRSGGGYSRVTGGGRYEHLQGGQEMSARAVQQVHVVLQSAFRWGVQSIGVLAVAPTSGLRAPRAARKEMRVLDDAQYAKLPGVLAGTPWEALFCTVLETGMRRSEVLALRWRDVDLEAGELRVNKALFRIGGEDLTRRPKSAKSRRSIALLPRTVGRLRELRDVQARQRDELYGDVPGPDGYIFCREDGVPVHPDQATKAWGRLVAQAGFAGLRLHDARHTHATMLLRAGIHPKIVQERLGHSTIALTLDTYSHVTPGMQEAAAQKLEEVLPKRPELAVIVAER